MKIPMKLLQLLHLSSILWSFAIIVNFFRKNCVLCSSPHKLHSCMQDRQDARPSQRSAELPKLSFVNVWESATGAGPEPRGGQEGGCQPGGPAAARVHLQRQPRPDERARSRLCPRHRRRGNHHQAGPRPPGEP
eukprot:scaffold479916_cov15-Prasinocladus_malaysianus.AAC.1